MAIHNEYELASGYCVVELKPFLPLSGTEMGQGLKTVTSEYTNRL
jgi:hypothetical protein